MRITAVALSASCLPLLLPWWSQGELSLAAGRTCAWVVLPWVALAGVPRRAPAPTASFVVALVLPLLALGAAADLAAERPVGDVALTAGVGMGLVVLLSLAARRAEGGLAHAVAWWALVPAASALALTAEVVGWNTIWQGTAALPLGWAARSAGGAHIAPWGALAAALILLGLARRLGKKVTPAA